MYDIIIIGCGCAGMTAAVYAGRAGLKVLLLEGEAIGGQIAYSHRVENFPSVESIDGATFSDRLFAQAQSFGADFEPERVLSLRRDGKLWTVITDARERECKAVIIASGMRRRRLELEGEERFAGQGISYCAVCDGIFYEGGKVAVVGGGNTALQDALYLSDFCKSVTVIHRRDEFRGDSSLSERVRHTANISLLLSSKVAALHGGEQLDSIDVESLSDGSLTALDIDCLFVAIGSLPETSAFSGIVKLDSEGFIDAREECVTSAEGVFAAGDCRSKKVRQLTTAAADGSTAALAAAEYCRSSR